MLTWIGVLLALVALYFLTKLAGFVLKLAMVVVVIGGVYLVAAPYIGMPVPFAL